MSRPSKLSRAVIGILAGAIERGVTLDTAARAAGIAPSTLYKWKADARDAPAGSLLSEFSERIDVAHARAELTASELVFAAMRGESPFDRADWKAAAWFLERRRPGWQRLELHELSTPEPADLDAELDAKRERLRELLEKVRQDRLKRAPEYVSTPAEQNGA